MRVGGEISDAHYDVELIERYVTAASDPWDKHCESCYQLLSTQRLDIPDDDTACGYLLLSRLKGILNIIELARMLLEQSQDVMISFCQ